MSVFVYDYHIIQISVPVAANIHLHSGPIAIGRGAKIGITSSRAVLSFGIYRVVPQAAISVIVVLKVTAGFIKTILVDNVVDYICPIKKIGYSSIFRLVANTIVCI